MHVRISACLALACCAYGQQVIQLGADPSTPSREKQYFSKIWNTEVVTNVSRPSISVYLPEASKATGTAVVVCPGGGFHALSINSEGIDVAKWLVERGVAAFVLKYRLVETGEDGTQEVMMKLANRAKFDADVASTVPLSIDDGLAAMKYVRANAAKWSVDPNRNGIMGFSAGGTVTMGVALRYDAASRPAFVAPIYAAASMLKDATIPADAPPAFILAATDDQLGLGPDSVRIYEKWTAAKRPAELHMYAKGGHGFGMRVQKLPTDRWIERFWDWLQVQGLAPRK